MKKQTKNTDKKYYVVLLRTPELTPEIDKGKKNKNKNLVISVMGIYKSLNTANKWARIYKNDIINIFDKAYKFYGWRKFICEDGTEDYQVKFKKSKEIFEVYVYETKIEGPPKKQDYELNLYWDNELIDKTKIERIENYLKEQAKELEKFEEDE